MANAKRPFNPSGIRLDDGREFDTTGVAGPALQRLGQMQEAEGDAAYEGEQRDANPFWGLSPSGMNFAAAKVRNIGNPMSGYFGLLQGKENAAQAAGKQLHANFRRWGNPDANIADDPNSSWNTNEGPFGRFGAGTGSMGEADRADAPIPTGDSMHDGRNLNIPLDMLRQFYLGRGK